MFFIGITGPLVTVIITLVLPFFLLIAQKPVAEEKLQTPHHEFHKSIVNTETSVQDYTFQTYFQAEATDFGLCNLRKRIKSCKVPILNQPLIKLLFTLNNSGNKAPPAFLL